MKKLTPLQQDCGTAQADQQESEDPVDPCPRAAGVREGFAGFVGDDEGCILPGTCCRVAHIRICSIRAGEDPQAYAAMLRHDLEQVQTVCREKTGCTPTVFAYPYGFICRESIPVLQELGFTCTLTCYEKPNYITRDKRCLYGLSRYNRPPGVCSEDFLARVLAQGA